MKTYKLTKNLWLHEYIPEELYRRYCEKKPHYLVNCLDPRLVKLDQFMRDRFGQVIINNWYNGDDRQWSGIRTPGSDYYSFFSEHSWGRASDKLFMNASSAEVREDIRQFYFLHYLPLGLSCIEDDVTWLHSDVRMLLRPGKLLIVKTNKKKKHV